MSAEPTYLIWSNANQAWWRDKSSGYTTFVSSAGRYSQAEAIKICAGTRDGWHHDKPPTEIPVSLFDVMDCYRIARAVETLATATKGTHP